jgi:arsenite methyltransferase
MSDVRHDQVRQIVRQQYARVAESSDACCSSGPSCCGTGSPEAVSQALGYSADETAAVPAGANMGLGCGNPQAIAALKPGETVLDLGSGGGFDCFLAARQVGAAGRVIGVDMTPRCSRRRAPTRSTAATRTSSSGSARSSTCPSPTARRRDPVQLRDQPVARQAARVRRGFRVLRPGGRLAISDVVAFADIPAHIREDMALLTGCMAGATPIAELEEVLHAAGFEDVRIAPKEESKSFIREWAPGTPVTDYVVAATIEAVKPVA